MEQWSDGGSSQRSFSFFAFAPLASAPTPNWHLNPERGFNLQPGVAR